MFKMALWACALLFVATLYNAVSAYDALGSVDVHDSFMRVGILEDSREEFPMPVRKPAPTEELASNYRFSPLR
jgi:hypothetical protein